MHNDKPLAVLKQDFSDALALFLSGDGEFIGRSELFRGYNRLLSAANKDPEILKFVFSSLLDALDDAPDGEVARVLHLYIFQDFLESHSSEPSVQETIVRFLDGGTLHKLPLQIALGQYRP